MSKGKLLIAGVGRVYIRAVGGPMQGARDLTVMETPVEAGSTGVIKSGPRGYGKPVKHVAH